MGLLPVIIISGVIVLLLRLKARGSNRSRQQLFLLLSVTAACSLIQFPFSAPIYFCYVAPLVILTAAAVVSMVARPPRVALVGALCFCLLYVVFEITPGFIYDMGTIYSPDMQKVTLAIPRAGGLRVFKESAKIYAELGAIILQHARGEYIYATPDCPEIYFLYGFRNPTRTLFEFLDAAEGSTERTLATIQQHHINLVILNREPEFSEPVPGDLRQALGREFPNRAEAGRFEARWKP